MRHPNHIPANLPIISLREPTPCDELGLCQHPVQCTGRTCYRDIVTPEPPTRAVTMPAEAGNFYVNPFEPDERQSRRADTPAIGTPFDEFTFWALCFAAYAAIFAMLGYLWGRHGDKIKAFIVNAWGLLA